MSNKRYRSRPGQPRTQEEAMVRAMAMEILERDLAELNQEISILEDTLELYRIELHKRTKEPDREWGRWNVAPGVALRAQAALRRLRDRRNKMIAETEAEVVEGLEARKQQQVETIPPARQPQEAPRAESPERGVDWYTAVKAFAKRAASGTQAADPGTAQPDKRKHDPVPA